MTRIACLFALCALVIGCRRFPARDAGPEDDAGPEADAGAAPNRGIVAIAQFTEVGVGAFTQLGAHFARRPLGEPPFGCTLELSAGACGAYRCTPASGGSDGAGTIDLAVGGLATYTFAHDVASGVYGQTISGTIFRAGDALTIESTGGTVPAFRAGVLAPTRPTVALPATIERNFPVTVSWTGAAAGDVGYVHVSSASSAQTQVYCMFDPESAMVRVEPAALTRLPAGPGTITLAIVRSERGRAGTYDLDVSAYDAVYRGVTLQ